MGEKRFPVGGRAAEISKLGKEKKHENVTRVDMTKISRSGEDEGLRQGVL